jgi:hypothetical protein
MRDMKANNTKPLARTYGQHQMESLAKEGYRYSNSGYPSMVLDYLSVPVPSGDRRFAAKVSKFYEGVN